VIGYDPCARGKTTVLLKIIDLFKNEGYSIGGMISCEARVVGTRIGFELLDVDEGKKGWLARADQKEGPRVGKYHVNLGDLEGVGANAILNAIVHSDVIVIYEVGPMELFSDQFVQAVLKAIGSTKRVICTVHSNMRSELLDRIEQREDAETYVVNKQNRDHLPELLAERTRELLGHSKPNKEL
jgi:nucleoside-triphosphatase